MSQYSERSMLPIFTLGGIVSGYASIASIAGIASVASIGSADGMDNKILNARPDVVMEAVEKVRRHRQEKFKSKFAKELNEQHLPVDNIQDDPGTKEKKDFPRRAEFGGSDLSRLKLENEKLKLNIENCLIEEKRYEHIQYELSQLRMKITKVMKWQS